MVEFNESLIIKYLNNDCSSQEELSLYEWLQESEENRNLYANLKKLWSLKKIDYYSDRRQIDKALASFNYHVKNRKEIRIRDFRIRLTKYAAIFLLLIGTPLLFWLLTNNFKDSSELITVAVSNSEPIKVITLNDGSKVWLNSGSTLQYPAEFQKNVRKVSLTGEAFWEVKKDPLHPFIVQTPSIQIKVLGTSFNVNTNASGNKVQTTLVSGRVSIQDMGGNNITVIKPGQMAIFNNQTRGIQINEVNTSLYTSWRFGLIVLEKATLNEIACKIESVYKLKIIIDTKNNINDRYNFVFRKNQSVDSVLEMLRFVTPFNYKRIGNQVFINKK
ncbi:MAG: FecR domain-containing protein [Bacteroidota bacterium]|nr:FecR domain-containing protein [Bacteroidota bacterium]